MDTKIPFIDLYKQHKTIEDELKIAITNCIKNSEFIRSQSIFDFEDKFSLLINSKNCISCGNGTDALYIAMKSLGVKEGDEVITTSLSWISTSETITQAGGKVIFCDINPITYCLDENYLESIITSKTVGIIPVHLYGQPCEMQKINQIAKKYNLWIIEDCAQAHLAKYKNRYVGTFGDVATFSFYPSKNLGAMGDAGCISTQKKNLAEWMRLFAQHGGKNIHKLEGINSRMDGIQASILLIKLKYLSAWTEKRRSISKYYSDRLTGIGDLALPCEAKNTKHVYHLYTIRTKYRDKLKIFLQSKGISTVINYKTPLPLLPCYSHLNLEENSFKVAKNVCDTLLCLPLFPEIDRDSQDYIISSINDFFESVK
tara:strand:+ start:102 stop:1214 length:1113 start_codon:yes stop_codon:yes gene_type:complete